MKYKVLIRVEMPDQFLAMTPAYFFPWLNEHDYRVTNDLEIVDIYGVHIGQIKNDSPADWYKFPRTKLTD